MEAPNFTAVSELDASHDRTQLSRGRRVAASLLLAIGLLSVGGVAIVNAASPSPSPGSSSGSLGGSSPGGTQQQQNCPNM
jgi:hypothetical protein